MDFRDDVLCSKKFGGMSVQAKLIYYYLLFDKNYSKEGELFGIIGTSDINLMHRLQILEFPKNAPIDYSVNKATTKFYGFIEELEEAGFILYDQENHIICLCDYLTYFPIKKSQIKKAVELIYTLPKSYVIENYFNKYSQKEYQILKDKYRIHMEA